MKRIPLLLSLLVTTACAGGGAPDSGGVAPGATQALRETGRTLVYECDAGDFIVRTGPGEIALWLEDRYRVLSQVRSASGTRYAEGDIVFWSKGDEAMLDVGDARYRNCSPNPRRVPWEDARRRGIDLRAVGNEPGWHVEVREGDSILFVGDYGASKFLFRDFTASEGAGSYRYVATEGGNRLTVSAESAECADTMSGDRFPLQVEILLNDRRYRGCGMTLEHPWE